MTPKEWKTCTDYLKLIFKTTFNLTAPEMAAWYETLKHYPAEHVMAACQHMARTVDAFPSLAQIVRAVEGCADDGPRLWEEVMQAVRTVGWCGTPSWSDSRIAAGVQMLGGWRAICEAPTEDLPAMRAHFFKSVKENTERQRLEDVRRQFGISGGAVPHLGPATQVMFPEGPIGGTPDAGKVVSIGEVLRADRKEKQAGG